MSALPAPPIFILIARLLRVCCVALILAAALTGADAQGVQRLALLIGNDGYRSVEPLANARNDARLLAGVLQSAGFDVTLATDLDRERLWRAIDTFKSRINKGDEVVFYFAGHGVQIGSNQLLLPVDISAQNDRQVERDGVSLVDVQDALQDARFAMLVIDACRDNPFPKQGTRSIGSTRGLLPPEPATGQVIVMSAGRNQKALDNVPGSTVRNGLFSYELAQVLQQPGLEVRAALQMVQERVDDKAKRESHEQRPSLVSDLRGNFFFFAPTGVGLSGQQSAAPSVPPRDPEEESWLTAQRVNTQRAFEAYVSAYPSGRFTPAARIALSAFDPPRATATAAAPSLVPPATTLNGLGLQGRPLVMLSTSAGDIVLELYPDKAPATVENFLQYVRDKYYDGTVFHRVIDGFMIQGGGYAADLAQKATRAPIKLEAGNGLKNERGTIAMARTSVPDSATAQFFINVADNPSLNAQAPSGQGYAVFGRVVQGMDTVDRIRLVPVVNKGSFQNLPANTVAISSASVIPARPK